MQSQFYRMERKIIKNHTAPHKKYLINLINIFNSIQIQLRKIPHFDSNNLIELKGINEDCIKRSPPQRHIKKQNEQKLFKETFQQICLINRKKPRGRKSDIVMKFTMVSNILIERMKESLCIKGQSKEMLINNISKLKDSFMAWGQHSQILQKHQHSSQSKSKYGYNLKYIYSQVATTNASAHNSRTMSKYYPQNDKKEDNRLGEDNQQSNLDDNSFKLHPKMQRYQRHTVNFNQESQIKKRNKMKRYTKNYMHTQQKKNPAQQNLLNALDYSINTKEKSQQIQRKPKKKTNFYDKTLTTVNKNISQSSNNIQFKCSSNQLIQEQKQMKKSAYYMSQNYIRSRKNIQNITLFVNTNNKTKKQINTLLGIDPRVQGDSKGHVFFQRTSGFKSTKFLTKKYIGDDQQKPNIIQTKSQKTIPRRTSNFINKNGNTHTGYYDKKPISKFHKNTQQDIQQLRFEKPPQFLKKQFTSIKQENGIEIMDSKANPQSNIEGKNIGQFYNQLGEMRSQFQRQFDPYIQNRSVFFQQQSTIWDQQKRRLQRVLEQRGRQLYFRQFKIQQQQALKAIRSDIFNSNQSPHTKLFTNSALDQIDLNKQPI